MPKKKTVKRAIEDKREGKSASRQAGQFVGEEIHPIREGKHGEVSRETPARWRLTRQDAAGKVPMPESGAVARVLQGRSQVPS